MEKVLQWDRQVSYEMWKWYNQRVGTKAPCTVLETSGHGVLWLAALVCAFLYPGAQGWWYALVLNLLVGWVTDLLLIVAIKPTFARRRPDYNVGKTAASVQAIDKHSFPSGHASRVSAFTALVAHSYLLYSKPSSAVVLAFFAWSVLVMESRVVMGRHHVLDVVAGMALGVANAAIVARLTPFHPASVLAFRERVLPWA